KAAGIKQPTLSQQINVLEEEMNVRLFYRNSKKVMLTTAGEKLFEKIFELKKELDTTIDSLKPEHSNDTVLKIGVMQGELDLYFDYDASDKKDNMTYLYEDGFNIIYTDKFKKINTDKLAEYPWILMNRQYSCRRIFSELENSNELEIVPIMELSDLAVVYNMVNNGLGVSLVSDTSLLFYDSDDLNVLKVKTEGHKRNVVMHHNGNLNINQHHQEFYNMTVNELKKLRIIK